MDYSSIFNNGVALGVVVYFMYITNTTLKSLTTTINNNTQIIRELKEDIRRWVHEYTRFRTNTCFYNNSIFK